MLANSRLSISTEAIDPLHEPWLPCSLVFIAIILHSGAVFTGRNDRSVRTFAGYSFPDLHLRTLFCSVPNRFNDPHAEGKKISEENWTALVWNDSRAG